jgi:hypothetical protein
MSFIGRNMRQLCLKGNYVCQQKTVTSKRVKQGKRTSRIQSALPFVVTGLGVVGLGGRDGLSVEREK